MKMIWLMVDHKQGQKKIQRIYIGNIVCDQHFDWWVANVIFSNLNDKMDSTKSLSQCGFLMVGDNVIWFE